MTGGTKLLVDLSRFDVLHMCIEGRKTDSVIDLCLHYR